MVKLALFLLASLLATQASAACLTAADLTSGISFTRANHRSGLAVTADDAVSIDHATSTTSSWTDQRSALLGIYDLSADFHFNAQDTVGGGSPHYDWVFAKRPPVLVSGTSVTTRVKQTRSEDIGTEFPNPLQVARYTATCTFLDAIVAKISGCPYTIIPVEAAFTKGPLAATQRWLYFPDLGFGIETRSRGFDKYADEPPGIAALTARK